MAAWGPLQRQLLTYLARHPQLKTWAATAKERVTATPAFHNAKQRLTVAFEKAGKQAAEAAAATRIKASSLSGSTSFGSQWSRKARGLWHQYRNRIIGFVAANFMGILLFVQFSSAIWGFLTNGVRSLLDSPQRREAVEQPEPHRRRRRASREEKEEEEAGATIESSHEHLRKAMVQSTMDASPATAAKQAAPPLSSFSSSSSNRMGSPFSSSSLFDDTVNTRQSTSQTGTQDSFNAMHEDLFRGKDGSMQSNFNTSFLVKMGDETEFMSSLEREGLTGAITKH